MNPDSRPEITVGIVTRNRLDKLIQAIESVYIQEVDSVEIIVVDNASQDETITVLRRDYPDIRLIQLGENVGCPGGRNHIYTHARGKYVVNLDDDGFLGKGALIKIIHTFDTDSGIGIVGMRECDPANSSPRTPQDRYRETGIFRGGLSTFRRSMLNDIGLYPADFYFYGEEPHLALRALNAGWRIVYHPGIIMWHPIKRSHGSVDTSRDYYLFRNPLIVVADLYPGWYLVKYMVLRMASYAVISLRRRTVSAYLNAVGAAWWHLLKNYNRRIPVSKDTIDRYFILRERGGGKPLFGENSLVRAAIIQNRFAHYRRALFSKLCSQKPPAIRYTLYFGQRYKKDTVETLNPNEDWVRGEAPRERYKIFPNRWLNIDICWQSIAVILAMGEECEALILEGNMYFPSNWLAAIIGRLTGKRVLFWGHGFKRRENNLKGWFRRRFYQLADGLLIYSHRGREICIEMGFNPEDVYLVGNSLDYDLQVRLREQIKPETIASFKKETFAFPDLPVIIWIGRLERSRKVNLLIRAASDMSAGGHPVNILIVGDGPTRNTLERQVMEFGLEQNVCFYGSCYREEELAVLIKSADLSVSPGAIGLACMHCLAYGIPVITHDCWECQKPEAEAIIPGETGDFYKFGDYQDMLDKITVWLEDRKDSRRIRQSCYLQIEKYFSTDFQIRVFNDAVRGVAATTCLPDD